MLADFGLHRSNRLVLALHPGRVSLDVKFQHVVPLEKEAQESTLISYFSFVGDDFTSW